MRHSAGIALVLAAGLAACASDEAAESFTLTDSSGVSIAVSREPLWPEGGGWRLGGQPTVVIGGGITDTSAIIGPIAGAMRLPDGRILVADEGATRLRWFADDGTILQSVGRKGEGPGEMQNLARLLHVGDSLATGDLVTSQVSLFSLDGDFGRRFHKQAPEGEMFSPVLIGRLESGDWIAVHDGAGVPRMKPGVRRDSVLVWRYGPGGSVAGRVAAILGGESGMVMGRGVIAPLRPLFAHRTTVRFHDGSLWTGTSDEFRVDQIDLDGRVVRSVRLDRPPSPITPAELQTARDSAHEAMEAYPEADAFIRALDEAPVPATKPAYQFFMFDDAGNLWIQHYEAGPALAASWAIIDTSGRWLGDVTLPPGLDPTHISATEVLGVWTDPDGAEHVVSYPLIRDSSSM